MSNREEVMTIKYEVDGNEIKLSPAIVKNYITGGVDLTDSEYKFFVELCKVRKLNPFLKEAYAIKFGDQPAQIVVGKDAILKRAVKHPQFNGKKHGIIVLNNETGELTERVGTMKLPKETLVGGWAKVYRKDWEYPTEVTVSFDEVAQKKRDGNLNSNWASKGATMVEKVAVVRALRETFVEDLGGMIDENEAWENKHLNEKSTPKVEIVEQVDVFDAEVQTSLDSL
jgi:phage recombination protein Bet